MEHDTKRLLEECSSGCKMAIGSMNQVEEYAQDDKLVDIIRSYRDKHEKLEQDISNQLKAAGEPEKEPGKMAHMFSWFTTEMKMMMEKDAHQISKLLMDGCNMGIQSVSEYQNKFTHADEESKKYARELVKMEEELLQELKQFL